jgi:DNA polymerase/3'-5' exonuclease PolX|tara:strand:- start:701 stop:1144 length:444 start_codon:yes stop_codon:yes gene_type:complete
MSDEVSEVLEKSVEHEKIPLDEVVSTYITIRNEKERRAREFQKKDQELKNDLEQLEQVMLNSCNEVNADSIKTSRGTIIKSLKENYVCSDWSNFKDFILDNEAPELLQQRIHQANFKEFLSSRTEEGLPPGISSMRAFSIVVRKPSK